MTPDPQTITRETPLEEVVRLMEQHRIKRLPVVQDGKVVGIVSRANLLHALASIAREVKPAARRRRDDPRQIMAECAKQPWAPRVNVVVAMASSISGRDHRRAGAPGVHRRRRECPRRESVHDHWSGSSRRQAWSCCRTKTRPKRRAS